MSTNSSPGRTVRLNTALNTALLKKRIKSDTRDKCNTDTQQTQTWISQPFMAVAHLGDLLGAGLTVQLIVLPGYFIMPNSEL